jgi:type I restriction enzyme S subunit
MSLPAYRSYRVVGTDFLSAVPEEWSVKPLKTVAWHNLEKLAELTDPRTEFRYIEISDVNGSAGIGRLEVLDFEHAPSRARRIVSAGDVIVSTVRTYLRAIATVPAMDELIIASTGFCALRARDVEPAFLGYAIQSAPFVEGVISRSVGVSYPAINADELVAIKIAVPSLKEQRMIATFLDSETTKIDRSMSLQRAMVHLLREKQQAYNWRKITKGIAEAAETRPTRAQWIGQVPSHWEDLPIRKVARLESGHTPSKSKPEYWVDGECTIPWFTLSDINQVRSGVAIHVADTENKISPLGLANSSARLLPAQTVFLSRTASVGFSGIMSTEMAVSQDFAAWICGERLLPEYLLLCLRVMKSEFQRLMMGSTHKTIYMPDIEKLAIPLPPIDEQRAIVNHVLDLKRKSDRLIDRAEASIKLLQERRSALISAAVTGKIDVRGYNESNDREAA